LYLCIKSFALFITEANHYQHNALRRNHARCPHSFFVPPQAHEGAYHYSASPVRHVVTGFSATRASEASPSPSAGERFRAALRREMAKAGLA